MTDFGFHARDSYAATVAQTVFSYTFPILASSDVKATVNGLEETDFTVGVSTITFGGSVTLANDDTVRIFRRSPATYAGLPFQPTAVSHLVGDELDIFLKQHLHLYQEGRDRAKTWGTRYHHLTGFVTAAEYTQLYLIDATAGDVTVSLEALATVPVGTELLFMQMAATGNDVILNPDGVEDINGVSTHTFSGEYAVQRILRDDAEWKVIT